MFYTFENKYIFIRISIEHQHENAFRKFRILINHVANIGIGKSNDRTF